MLELPIVGFIFLLICTSLLAVAVAGIVSVLYYRNKEAKKLDGETQTEIVQTAGRGVQVERTIVENVELVSPFIAAKKTVPIHTLHIPKPHTDFNSSGSQTEFPATSSSSSQTSSPTVSMESQTYMPTMEEETQTPSSPLTSSVETQITTSSDSTSTQTEKIFVSDQLPHEVRVRDEKIKSLEESVIGLKKSIDEQKKTYIKTCANLKLKGFYSTGYFHPDGEIEYATIVSKSLMDKWAEQQNILAKTIEWHEKDKAKLLPRLRWTEKEIIRLNKELATSDEELFEKKGAEIIADSRALLMHGKNLLKLVPFYTRYTEDYKDAAIDITAISKEHWVSPDWKSKPKTKPTVSREQELMDEMGIEEVFTLAPSAPEEDLGAVGGQEVSPTLTDITIQNVNKLFVSSSPQLS